MNDSNPYASPKSDSVAEDTSNKPRRPRFRIRSYVIPAFIGAVIGWFLLAPYFSLGPGDPSGHSVAAGLGGFVGLFVGIVIHTFTRKP